MNLFSKFFKSSNHSANEINLKISSSLEDFTKNEVLPGLNISPHYFWSSFENLVEKFSSRNKNLLIKRSELQEKIDHWHIQNRNKEFNLDEYKNFLTDIGYLHPRAGNFKIKTWNVDPEIRKIAGPQLVVPVMNARFALNAANARWGSLYDSLYGTNIITDEDGATREGGYNPIRGNKVIEFAKKFLDETIPMQSGSYDQVIQFQFIDSELSMKLEDGKKVYLKDIDQYVGYKDEGMGAYGLLFKNNNLHFEIQIDRSHPIGQEDKAGIKDILMESAVTSIQDCEDSVAAVDAEDKIIVYRNWLGLMKGNLKRSFDKDGKFITRELNPDRKYLLKNGKMILLPGRSLMLVRNVGHLMTNPAIKDKKNNNVPEGIMDAFFTICIAIHDIIGNGIYKNSKTKSIYIVKPKMHGPEEVQFTCDLFSEIEKIFDLPENTVKLGIMDEERRTTVNLKECIEIAKHRVIFINTGFLDRTGDEIHTSMEAGPMVTKADMKMQKWINAYENWNVDIGLETGFKGNAQIGKGMWPMPDEMLDMYKTKAAHPKAGANCAWVPSPTAATIHAMHYHQISVQDEQDKIIKRERAKLDDLLLIPFMKKNELPTDKEITAELENNAQGILGYVVRWVDQGIGCSKVPDINDVGLMEDRATCRISSQHISNWLHHGLCSEVEILEIMKKMAKVVDSQNKDDVNYRKMSPSFDSIAFKAACELAIKGKYQPSGYTEPILHKMRLRRK
ncbi:MAG: malate synthase G [SAR86 cluster bacterium]|jgi:malate synthase|uniref:Malate synthase G n=1 Tax=SAR86 cluster bacterium TaxID=2030880 RepID=A0A520N353_9GAMM|nr:MAG: malate synthase G [SAR86 cluster bacterium]RZO27915.1 MAG: malate synthase G [SAR86 cluster bacterium]|tara:strand:+ start:610 stop:2802 length:2193 start_codon:yes stop_codon:yes gene_type:complete